jgi:hypothetical protein
MNKSSHNLEQENIELRQAVVNEKLNKAEALFTHRLVYIRLLFLSYFS